MRESGAAAHDGLPDGNDLIALAHATYTRADIADQPCAPPLVALEPKPNVF